MPGDYVQLATPSDTESETVWAVEPRHVASFNNILHEDMYWPPVQSIHAIDHAVHITNTTMDPIVLKQHEHVCQIRALADVPDYTESTPGATRPLPESGAASKAMEIRKPFSSQIALDPDNVMPPDTRARFAEIHRKYDDVFDPRVKKYNCASGKIEERVNMGPTLPPQRKGRLPHYNRDQLDRLQN